MTPGIEAATWRKLLETAIHSPSPHNVQPWHVRIIDDTTAELSIEKARTLPNEDVTGSFIILTMGMFVETLRMVAASEHLALDDTVLEPLSAFSARNLTARAQARIAFARLTLRPDTSVVPEFPLALFRERRTSRLHYRSEPVPARVAEGLGGIASAWGHRYHQTTDAVRIERLLDWNIAAVFEDLNHPPYRDELRSWLRYTKAGSNSRRDGLDARCMNVSPIELWMAFRAGALLRWRWTRPPLRRRYRAQIGPVATIGALSGPFWEPEDAYPTGRFLMRFWLETTRLGYSIHPYGNLVTNRPTAARVEADLGIRELWLIFKIGRSDPAPASRRRPVEEITRD